MMDGGLDFIAVTDHNTTEFARGLHKKFGDKIIVGEEITTSEGEIIGLYLKNDISPGLSAKETAKQIKAQGGLVYIPHPFENVRKGLTPEVLQEIVDLVDIVEVRNGRAVFQNKSQQAEAWTVKHGLPGAAGSDAHGWHGWGRTYSVLKSAPTRSNLARQLLDATHRSGSPGLRGILYPKLNRIIRRRSA
jgi:hypothetical protein